MYTHNTFSSDAYPQIVYFMVVKQDQNSGHRLSEMLMAKGEVKEKSAFSDGVVLQR